MKKLILIVVLFISVGLGIYLYLSRQFNYLPEWYQENRSSTGETVPPSSEPVSPAPTPPTVSPRSSLQQPATPPSPTAQTSITPRSVNKQLQKSASVRLTEAEVSELVRSAIAGASPDGKAEFLKALRTHIRKDNLTVEMVTDMKRFPWDHLPSKYQFARQYLTRMGKNRSSEVYIEFSGKPKLVGNKLIMDEDSTVKIGAMAYSLKTLTTLLGLGKQFSGEIPLPQDIPFSDVILEDGALVLEK